MARWPVVRLVLLLLNVMSTLLMVFSGLREDPILAAITGRYAYISQRLQDGSINYEIAEADHYRLGDLPTPKELAEYTFLKTPRRDPASIGEYRSVCTNINTNSAPMLVSYNDDYWSQGPRRVQIYVYSMSTPHCQVVTVKPAWRDQCIADHDSNATRCYQHVLANFDALRVDWTARLAVPKDFGAKGVPFLRCAKRPLASFKFNADLLAHQTYWSGGRWHVTIQTSECRGEPLVRSDDRLTTLFESVNVDEAAEMLVLLPPPGWIEFLITWLYSVTTLTMIAAGLLVALFRSSTIKYLPEAVRFGANRKWMRFLLPEMAAVIQLSENDRAVVSFKGSLLLGSDVWISHWFYMWLSIVVAVSAINLRYTYVIFQVATSLMIMKLTMATFIFMCESITKITWLMCLVQTLVRVLIKLFARFLRATRLIKSTTRQQIEWAVDSAAMFLSFRVYNLMLFVIVLSLIQIKGNPSFQVQANPYKVGAYGGIVEISHFWGSEVACDLTTILAILAVAGQVLGLALLTTKYRHVADNTMVRFLQQRFVISGWDGLMTASMLGLDPYDPEVLKDDVAYTKCSIGSILQLLFMSGPSGFVHLAGDYIFHDGGFTKDPVRFRYPIPKALSMGLFLSADGLVIGKSANNTTLAEPPSKAAPSSQQVHPGEDKPVPIVKSSIFLRRLRIVSEGCLGRILLIDQAQDGANVTNKEAGQREFEVTDALTTMSILDIKWLLGSNEKKLYVQ